MKDVFAEISEDERWVEIFFEYDPAIVSKMNHVKAIFVPKTKGGPLWKIPLDYEETRMMALSVGKEDIEIGDALLEWSRREKVRADMFLELINAKDAKLDRLPKILPELNRRMRPDQRVGVQWAAYSDAPLIADKMGLGKTWEAIATVYETGNEDGPHLVSAPITSLETVWEEELHRWTDQTVLIAAEQGMGRGLREEVLSQAQVAFDAGIPFWLVVNPAMVSFTSEFEHCNVHTVFSSVKDRRKCEECKEDFVPTFPWIHEVVWRTIILDEVHVNGLRNPKSLVAQGMNNLKSEEDGKRIIMSGTPMGGKPINLWPLLHWQAPDRFRSRWRWGNLWLDSSDNGYGTSFGDVRQDREEEFYRHLAPWVLQRTKEEVLPDLPPKQHIEIWCDMTPAQKKQYKEFAREAQIKIRDEDLSATSILAEYTRLKQFAGAAQDIRQGNLYPRTSSGKLNSLLEKLEELGIFDEDSDEQVVIFTQFERLLTMIYDVLVNKGVPTVRITGKEKKRGQRAQIQRSFQKGEPRICIMTTKTGGVSINLDRANYCFILDEMWNPDDQEQATDRIHRASRIHQVTVYWLRTKGTIEDYIRKVTNKKDLTNKKVLKGLRLF